MARVIILVILLVINFFSISYANDDIGSVIDLYKNGKYEECIKQADSMTQSDPTSVLGYYYLALSYAHTGKKELAIKNYDKVIALGTNKSLVNYAKSGKAKLSAKEKTKQVTGAESMLEDVTETQNTEQKNAESVKAVKETSATVNIKKNETTAKQPVAEKQPVTQKPVQKTSNEPPTNDEIVNAIRVLQRAGLLQGGLGALTGTPQTQQYPQANPQSYMDPRTQEMQQMLMMMNSGNNNNYNNNNDLMQMLPYMQNGGKMSPQMIQMMMMKNMVPDFSSGNNNGY